MQLPVAIRRQGFRTAYALLRAYWFVRRPCKRGVKCVLTDAGQRVLLVRHTYGHREWDFPGGSMKRGEQPVEAARREMHEELGLEIDGWKVLGEIYVTLDGRRDTIHCLQAEVRSPISIDRAELDAADWFARDRLPGELSRYVHPVLAHMPAG